MISASFLIIYPFAGELYPTQVRGIGIGTSSYIGGMGLIGIPFITYLVYSNIHFTYSYSLFNIHLFCYFSGKRQFKVTISCHGQFICYRGIKWFSFTRNITP